MSTPKVTPETKARLASAVVELGVRAALAQKEAIAEQSGMSVGQVKKQLESGRGVRRALLEYTESLNHDK